MEWNYLNSTIITILANKSKFSLLHPRLFFSVREMADEFWLTLCSTMPLYIQEFMIVHTHICLDIVLCNQVCAILTCIHLCILDVLLFLTVFFILDIFFFLEKNIFNTWYWYKILKLVFVFVCCYARLLSPHLLFCFCMSLCLSIVTTCTIIEKLYSVPFCVRIFHTSSKQLKSYLRFR